MNSFIVKFIIISMFCRGLCVHIYLSPEHTIKSITNKTSTVNATSSTTTTTELYNLFEDRNYWSSGTIPLLNKKIFQGSRVSIREHPYVASIRRNMAHYSIATVLTMNVVITIAHPLYKTPIDELCVVFGENYADRGASLWNVVLKIVHENFDPYTLQADLALLRIYPNIILKVSVKPISMFCRNRPPLLEGVTAFVTGWGRCDFTGKEMCLPRSSMYSHDGEYFDPMLKTVRFPIRKHSNFCSIYTINDVKLKKGMMCLGQAREVQSLAPCMAAPAAPLVALGKLLGLLSWGYGCGYSNDLPLVYTDLRYYNLWILRNLKILSTIDQAFFKELFNVTRAAILIKWLRLTRVNATETEKPSENKITVLNIDKHLAYINGTLFDIRDYIFEGAYRKYKSRVYEKLRQKIVRRRKAKKILEEVVAEKNKTTPIAHIFTKPGLEPAEAIDYEYQAPIDPWNKKITDYDEESTKNTAADVLNIGGQ